MLKNVGSADRILRIAAAVVLFIIVFTGVITGIPAVIAGIVAAVILITGIVGTCPIYLLLNLSTNRKVVK